VSSRFKLCLVGGAQGHVPLLVGGDRVELREHSQWCPIRPFALFCQLLLSRTTPEHQWTPKGTIATLILIYKHLCYREGWIDLVIVRRPIEKTNKQMF